LQISEYALRRMGSRSRLQYIRSRSHERSAFATGSEEVAGDEFSQHFCG
jgi:hypothetical protein